MKMVIRTVVKTLTLHRVGKSGARPPICTSEMNNVAKGQALLVVQIQRIRSSMWEIGYWMIDVIPKLASIKLHHIFKLPTILLFEDGLVILVS